MKLARLTLIAVASAALVLPAAAQSRKNEPPLGDVARDQRATSKTRPQSKRVYTEDDMPSVKEEKAEAVDKEKPADERSASADKSSTNEPKADGKAEAGDKKDATKDGEKKDGAKTSAKKGEKELSPMEARQKAAAEWDDKISAQQKVIADLEHQAETLDREQRLRVTASYYDAGSKIQNSKAHAEEQKHYEDESASLRDKITEERNKLADLEEQARKSTWK